MIFMEIVYLGIIKNIGIMFSGSEKIKIDFLEKRFKEM